MFSVVCLGFVLFSFFKIVLVGWDFIGYNLSEENYMDGFVIIIKNVFCEVLAVFSFDLVYKEQTLTILILEENEK